MATRTDKPKPNSDEDVLVRLSDASHFDQWVADGCYVVTRGAPPVPIPHAEAERIVAEAAGCLEVEET